MAFVFAFWSLSSGLGVFLGAAATCILDWRLETVTGNLHTVFSYISCIYLYWGGTITTAYMEHRRERWIYNGRGWLEDLQQ